MLFAMDVRPFGDNALLISGLSASRWKSSHRFAEALLQSMPKTVREIVPAFDSVAVVYDPLLLRPGEDALEVLGGWVLLVFEHAKVRDSKRSTKALDIPVSYGGAAGPDLTAVADQLEVDAAEVVRLHTSATYQVVAVGFMPGFAYLDGLPDLLKLPRRSSPRPRVPAGSVGLGGPYTGVYPFESPGGWHLIGRTSLHLFDPQSPEGSLVSVGDVVRFVAAEVT